MNQPASPMAEDVTSNDEPLKPAKTFFSGFAMGACTVIPGGDSGTIALILGIYYRIVTAISRVDATFIKYLLTGKIKAALQYVDAKFMICLLLGVGLGIALIGKSMHYLIEHHTQIMMPIFFGLIAASCWLVAKLIKRWGHTEISLLIAGAALALWMMLQPGMANPPDDLWYITLCGALGICALILPGISGAFLLLILGKYHDLTGVIDRATSLKLESNDFAILVAFGIGCAVGLVGCSKFLKWLLEHKADATMAALCGFKIGSLYKIWPFQRDTTPEILEFKRKVFEPIPLREMEFNNTFWIGLGLVFVSAFLTLLLDYVALKREKVDVAEAVSGEPENAPVPSK